MRNLILFLMMLMVPQVFAQTTPNTQTYYEFLNSPVNMIKNPHARLNTGSTVFGGSGAKGRASGTSELYGLAAHTCSTTAVSSYCELTMNAAKAPFNSANKRCEASILYNGANADLMALSYTPSGGQEVLVPLKTVTGTDYAEGYVELSCSSGVGSWKIKQIAAGTTGTIKYGGYYGPSTRTGKQSDTNAFSAFVSGTGTVSGETPGEWINGNCAVTDTSLYTCNFNSGFTTTAPVCTVAFYGGEVTAQVATQISNTSSTSVSVRTGYSGTSSSFTKYPYGFNLSCTKTDPASQYTVATVDNQDFATKTETPSWSNLGFTPGSNVINYSKSGDRLIASGFVKYASGTGSGSALTLNLPAGLTIDTAKLGATDNTRKIGSFFWYDDAGSASILDDSFGPVIYNSGNSVIFRTPNNSSGFATSVMTTNDAFSFSFEVPIVGWNPAPSGLMNIDVPVYTVTRLTSGSGTYTPPAGVKWLEIEMVGGGGGGAAAHLTSPPQGTKGGNTTFGTSLLYAEGGWPGAAGSPNTFSNCTVSSPATPLSIVFGAPGGASNYGGSWAYAFGSEGGNSPLGGAGGNSGFNVGKTAAANSGSGGGGGGVNATVNGYGGSGGNAGCYLKAVVPVPNPSVPFPYAVGAGGPAGIGSANLFSGGAGAAGVINIKEHYTNFTPALASGLLQRLPGGVTSDSTSAMRIEYAYVSASGVVSQESSDWINGNAVITDTSAFVLTKSSGGAGLTNCWSTILGTPSSTASASTAAADSTTVNIRTYTNNAYAVQQFRVFCMGPR